MSLSNTAVPIYYGQFRDAVQRGDIPVCREIEMEMNRIDDLIRNPNYYYDMLVYMYILGNKDNVCKRFKNLVDKKCEWYESYKKYDYNNFNKSCDVIMDVVRENN